MELTMTQLVQIGRDLAEAMEICRAEYQSRLEQGEEEKEEEYLAWA